MLTLSSANRSRDAVRGITMKNVIPQNPKITLAAAATKEATPPTSAEIPSAEVEYLMPYGAAAKAIFIKANGQAAYNYSRRSH